MDEHLNDTTTHTMLYISPLTLPHLVTCAWDILSILFVPLSEKFLLIQIFPLRVPLKTLLTVTQLTTTTVTTRPG